MASDMISRKALLKTLNNLESTGGHKYYRKGANDVLHEIMPQIIADEPTVDAVEVVRCKDCMFYQPYEGEEHKGECEELVGLESCVYEDDFCSYGCRMEE